MAYADILASVSERQIEAMRSGRVVRLRPSLTVWVSHLLAYWHLDLPIGVVLGQALDGGERLSPIYQPVRHPVFHRPAQVRVIYNQLTAMWQKTKERPQGASIDGTQIDEVIRLFSHATTRHECVVSAIETNVPFEMVKVAQNPAPEPEIFDKVAFGCGAWVTTVYGICYWHYRRALHLR